MTIESLVRAHIQDAPSYSPILPFEVLSKKVGIPAEQIVKLDANENPYGMSAAIRNALCESEFGHIYPDPESRTLRAAIAENQKIPFDNLMVGAGADELIDLLMRLFLEPGDVLLNAPPTFGMYAFDGGVNAAKVVNVNRRADFSLDIEGLEFAAEVHGAKLLFLASPNNPDGSLIEKEDLLRLLELPLIVVLDEAYIEFSDQAGSEASRAVDLDNLVVLRTFSKWAGLAGLRIGYGIFPSWMMPYLWKVKQPYNVSVTAQTAAVAALKNKSALDHIGSLILQERERLECELGSIDWLSTYPSQANFILCKVHKFDAKTIKEKLAEKGIFIRYFDKPGLNDHIRVSVGRPQDTDGLIEALKAL